MNTTRITEEKLGEVPVKRQYLLEKRGRRPKNVTPEEHATSDRFRAKDTKNVVKNIFRLFKAWTAKNTPEDQSIPTTLKQLRSDVGKYNNSLVLSISQNPVLRGTFL